MIRRCAVRSRTVSLDRDCLPTLPSPNGEGIALANAPRVSVSLATDIFHDASDITCYRISLHVKIETLSVSNDLLKQNCCSRRFLRQLFIARDLLNLVCLLEPRRNKRIDRYNVVIIILRFRFLSSSFFFVFSLTL